MKEKKDFLIYESDYLETIDLKNAAIEFKGNNEFQIEFDVNINLGFPFPIQIVEF